MIGFKWVGSPLCGLVVTQFFHVKPFLKDSMTFFLDK